MRVGYPIFTLLLTIILACFVQFGGYELPGAPTVAWSALPGEWVPLLIFLLRTSDLTISTIRTLTIVQGSRTTAWLLAFLQSSLFVTGVAGVLGDLDNPLNLAAYASGFAFGNVLGMAIESKIAPGHILLRITSSNLGEALTRELRARNYGVTELAGTGMKGTVHIMLTFIPRREIRRVKDEILAIDPNAFITMEPVRQLQGGWKV
jgi:uncharacterized protein YebE (UPF0316 family)